MTLPFNQLLNNFRGTGPFLFMALGVAVAVTALLAVAANARDGSPFWRTWWRRTLPVLSIWSIVAIILVGLRPGETGLPPLPSQVFWNPLAEFAEVDPGDPWASGSLILGNVMLFIPAGFFLAMWRPRLRVWQITLGGLGLSVGVELAQWWFVTDRSAATGDLVMNTLGAFLGAAAARGLHIAAKKWRRGDSNP